MREEFYAISRRANTTALTVSSKKAKVIAAANMVPMTVNGNGAIGNPPPAHSAQMRIGQTLPMYGSAQTEPHRWAILACAIPHGAAYDRQCRNLD
jgi:hypothetical protein